MKYKLGILFGVLGIFGFLFSVGVQKVKANPTFFNQSVGTASATTSPVSISGGTATTTEQFDSSNGYNQAYDSAALLVQFTGSSTASNININIENSQDGIDWYAQATSSVIFLPFASTTVNGAGGTSNISTRIYTVATPTRYIRSVITMPIGSLKGMVWQRFVGKRQAN